MKLERKRAMQFFAKVNITDTCWLWSASVNPGGYGNFHALGRNQAHAVSFIHHKWPVPESLELDHLCSLPTCVNPAHLEAVTPAQNHARKKIRNRWRGWPARCKAGHLMDDHTTFWRANGTGRQCRVCQRERQSEHSIKNGGTGFSPVLGPNGTLKNKHLYALTAADYEAAGITEAFIEVFWQCDSMLQHGSRNTPDAKLVL